jgi:histidyl-tRNA synthetase
VAADAPFEDRPLKAQLKLADRAGARFAAILGEREIAERTVTLRRLRDGEQRSIPRTDLVRELLEASG